MTPPSCQEIKAALASTLDVRCVDVGEDLLISTPWMFGDGDHIEFFLRERESGFMLDDFGTLVGRFRERGLDAEDGALAEQVNAVLASHGAELRDSAVALEIEEIEWISDAYARLVTAILQADALHHAARDAALAFSQRIIQWLQSTTAGPIVAPRHNVHLHGRRYRLNAALYRTARELEAEDPTLLHTAANRSSLEHCHYMFSDLEWPQWRKLTIITDRQLKKNLAHVERLAEVATVGLADSPESVLSWTLATDEERREGPAILGTSQPRLS